VNRAAGRRALARLAREVKRVTAGVGRNAAPPGRPAPPRPPAAPHREPTPGTAARDPGTAPAQEAQKDEFPDLALVLPRAQPAWAAVNADESATAPKAGEPPLALPGADSVDDLLANFSVSGATTDRAVSRELKGMVGLDPTPPPVTKTGTPEVDGIDDLLAMTDQSIPIANVRPPTPRGVAPPAPPPVQIVMPPSAAPVLEPPQRTVSARQPPPSRPPVAAVPAVQVAVAVDPPEQQPQVSSRQPYGQLPPQQPAGSRHAKTVVMRPRPRRIDRILTVLTLVVLVGGVAAVWTLKPGFFTGRTPEKVEQERQAAAAASLAALAQQQQVRCKATLAISDVPAAAEVLLRVGQAPVDIERMPIGARLEFVATAEGYAPKRSIIPAAAPWDPGPDGKPRYELAVQLDPTKQKPGKEDPWPAGEPGSVVGGKGAPGTVHVVSTPRGAEMWLLVGAGPEATIDPIKCEVDAEILVAGPTTYRKRLKVTSVEIGKAPIGQTGGHTVHLSAK
jgi:hypothetical protein